MRLEEQIPVLRELLGTDDPSKPPAQEHLGWLGHVFGARYASTNIAGAVAIGSLLMLALMRFSEMKYAYEQELITGSLSLVSLALGYLFGVSRTG